MKKTYKYIIAAAISFAAVGCGFEEFNPDRPSAESGDEVQFGLSLENPYTKTVYGDEVNNTFPIYWVNGDKVQIFSPQCLSGRRSAEYMVTVVGENQDYANSLTKTGEHGVQWGDAETADFYSLYPSGSYTLSKDGEQAEGVSINYNQNILVNGGEVKSDMEDCLMYASTTGVNKGSKVNLVYRPIATVINVKISVAVNTDSEVDEFTIQSVTLKANNDQNIAGTFSLNVQDGTFGEFETGAATVQAHIKDAATGGFITLKNDSPQNMTLTVPLFLAPCDDYEIDNWKIIVVANNVEYTKTLNIDKPLRPGEIHKIVLPTLAPAAKPWEPGNWMERIPRNVYLSEVSLPGTWNSLNEDCQSVTSIATQYGYGVRAFHIDTRWRAENQPMIGNTFTNWVTKPEISNLSVAIGGSGNDYEYDGKKLTKKSVSTFAEYLGQITSCVKENEYMVLVCTFAQNSYNGEDQVAVPTSWMQAISNACKDNNKVFDARKLNKNTVIGDVLNHVIVIVNYEQEVSVNNLLQNSKCLFTYMPMVLTESIFNNDDNQDELWTSNSTADTEKLVIYNNAAQISATTAQGFFKSNDRGYAPSLSERDAVLNKILDWSKLNYAADDYQHNMWLYLGLGGYQMTTTNDRAVSGSYAIIENYYNTMINDRVIQMGVEQQSGTKTPYYPVGIVLMNNKKGSNYQKVTNTTSGAYTNGADLKYGFTDVVKNILLMNNKYQLQYDPNKPADWGAQATAATEYAATASNGGIAISLD